MHKVIPSYKRTLIGGALAVTVAVLAACGGGGGGGAAAVPNGILSASNYQSVANASAAAISDSSTSSSFGKIAQADASAPSSVSSILTASTYELSQFAINSLFENRSSSSRETPQGVRYATSSCSSGGSIGLTANDANNNGAFDAGDTGTITFTNCAPAAGQAAMNGVMNLSVTSITKSGSTVTGGNFTVSFSNLASGTVALNGAMNLTYTSTLATLTYSNFKVTRAGKTTTHNYIASVDTSGAVTKLNLSGPLVIDGAAYTLSTITPLSYVGSNATAGLLRASDSLGNRADIAPSGAQFTVSFYPVGAAAPTLTYTKNWAEIL